jgi:hypothetical protein
LRRSTAIGDGLTAVVGVFALRALGATWSEVLVIGLVTAVLTALMVERPFRFHLHRGRHRRRGHRSDGRGRDR